MHYRCIAVLHNPLLYFSSPFDTTQPPHRLLLISIVSRTHNQTSCSQSFTPGQGRATQYTHPRRLPACICPSLSHGVLLACSAHPARDGAVWRGKGRKQFVLKRSILARKCGTHPRSYFIIMMFVYSLWLALQVF